MTRISSRSTAFFKRGFPVLWFGFIAVQVVLFIATGAAEKAPPAFLAPILLTVVGVVVMKAFLWDLVDEVYDGGDHLLVRNGGQEEAIPLGNIMNVSATMFVNPPRISLRLATPSRFGDEVVFSPAVGVRLNPFKRLPLIDDLIVRVDRARRQSVG
jgi:hypothetical protein